MRERESSNLHPWLAGSMGGFPRNENVFSSDSLARAIDTSTIEHVDTSEDLGQSGRMGSRSEDLKKHVAKEGSACMAIRGC